MMSKIEVERIRPDHELRNSSKTEMKINKEKLKVTNYWKKVLKSSIVSVLVAKFTKKLSMFLKRNSAKKSCRSIKISNLVVYSITSAGLKLPNLKNPISPKSLKTSLTF